jgi:hypothetical protein
MHARLLIVVKRALVAGLVFGGTPLNAQQQGVTLQLPTFSSFSVTTSVLVPDSGGAYMGGIGRGRSSRNRHGAPFGRGQNATGSQRQAAGMHVQAHVHDLSGMDKALRGPGPLSRQMSAAQSGALGEPIASLKDIERERKAAADAQQAEATDLFRRGREAQAAGKTSLAKTYYQMALRRATGELREQIAAQLR